MLSKNDRSEHPVQACTVWRHHKNAQLLILSGNPRYSRARSRTFSSVAMCKRSSLFASSQRFNANVAVPLTPTPPNTKGLGNICGAKNMRSSLRPPYVSGKFSLPRFVLTGPLTKRLENLKAIFFLSRTKADNLPYRRTLQALLSRGTAKLIITSASVGSSLSGAKVCICSIVPNLCASSFLCTLRWNA